ncbi:hypothetical protein [Agrobacterium sp. CG674]
MTRYFFHMMYETATRLDVDGCNFANPCRAITEAELNLLTFALEAKVRGKPVPRQVAVIEEGKPRRLVAMKSTD